MSGAARGRRRSPGTRRRVAAPPGLPRVAAALAVLAVATLAVAACGESAGEGAAAAQPVTYRNAEYGFSLTYDPRFTQTAATVTDADVAFSVAFADLDGVAADGRAVDVIEVAVFELPDAVKPADVPRLKPDVDAVAKEMLAPLDGATVTEPLSATKVGGVPGFTLSYTFSEGGTELTAATWFLFKGDRQYQLVTQASSADWTGLEAPFAAAVESFTID